MLSALLLALREGLEAALIVGIVLVYLNRTGRNELVRYVWGGVALAAVCSIIAAIVLEQWKISEDGFEGVLMLVAAVLVVTVIVWMNRVSRRLRKEIEQRVEAYAQKGRLLAGLGIGLFVYLMVLREGAELVLILRAVELSIAGVQVWIGTGLGIALAIGVGLFFFQGTLKIPIGRFFKATSIILMVVAFQLGLTGVHELSEAQWITSSREEMATVGPIVRNEFFFFVVILGIAAIVVLREWFVIRHTSVESFAGSNPAEKRLRGWEQRRQRWWSLAAASLCFVVLISLTGEFVYSRVSAAPPDAKPLSVEGGLVRVPIADLIDSNLRFYQVETDGSVIRFLIFRRKDGDYAAALDACEICGAIGYRQEGSTIVCRNCGATINPASIGQPGGCNPIALKSQVEGPNIIVSLSALETAMAKIQK